MESFIADFVQFLSTFAKFPHLLRVLSWNLALTFQSEAIFKSFSKSWGNSYIQFLVIIMWLHFTCSKGKASLNVKKSQDILWQLVWKTFACFLFSYQYVKTAKMSIFWKKNRKSSHKYSRAAIKLTFGAKFELE